MQTKDDENWLILTTKLKQAKASVCNWLHLYLPLFDDDEDRRWEDVMDVDEKELEAAKTGARTSQMPG